MTGVNITTTQAWLPANAIVKIENKTTGSRTNITTLITNFKDGGGDKDTDSIPHFGNAFLVIRKPQKDFEVEFEIDITDTSWMETISGDKVSSTGFSMIRSGGSQNPYKIKIEWKDLTTSNEGYKIIYYNAYSISVEKDNAADDRLTGTIKFHVTPTSSAGSPQRLEMETSDVTSSVIGSKIAGSYGSYEAIYDTLYGYGTGSML